MREEELQELMYNAVLGELSAEDETRLQHELQASPELRREHDALSMMWQQLGEALDVKVAERVLIGRSRRPQTMAWTAWGAAAAAVLLAFLAGTWWGQRPAAVAPTSHGTQGEQFAILLYAGGAPAAGGPGADAGAGDAAGNEFMARVVQEHRDWATQLQEQNRHVLSEKLSTAPGVDLVVAGGQVEERHEAAESGARRLGGLYIVTARDLQAATEIARGCPLLKYGGMVRVRAIEHTRNQGAEW